ncbi:MAG: leucine-rich repeat domain-containing protein [Lachnospiraceae bacterium]|nr:leucine-rich repeat domain-containing protein [Lachnospiraceae bacterium]
MRVYDKDSGLYFEIKDGTAEVSDCDKDVTEVVVPEFYEGSRITGIKKKAFLGRRQLRSVALPEGIKRIGQWAFSSCDALREVSCYRREIIFEPGAFKGDDGLLTIDVKGNDPMIGRLMAAHVVMEAEYLLDVMSSDTKEWLIKWDRRLSGILDMADDEGYHLYVLCGEEDLHYDYDQYLEHMRKKKSGLCMLRLLNDIGLEEGLKRRISKYLREHTKGCESEAAWRYLVEKHGDDTGYYRLMIELDCINEDNLEAVIMDLSDRHAEAKSYLLNSFSRDKDDFFEDLFL